MISDFESKINTGSENLFRKVHNCNSNFSSKSCEKIEDTDLHSLRHLYIISRKAGKANQ